MTPITKVEKKRVKDSIPDLEKAIELDPENSQAHYLLGICYRDQKDLNRAVLHLAKSNKIAPKYYTQVELAETYRQNKEIEKAIEFAEKGLKERPEYGYGLVVLGLIQEDMGRREEAIQTLQKVEKWDSNYAWAMSQLALIYKEKKDYSKALESAEKALQKNLDYGYGLIVKGNILAASEKNEEAVKTLERVKKDDPDYAYALNQLGVIYHENEKLRDYKKSYEIFEQSYKLKPDDTSIRLNFAEANLTTGRYEEAYRLAEKLLKEASPTPSLELSTEFAKFIMISSRTLQGKGDEILEMVREFIRDYQRMAVNFEPGWQFGGTKRYLEESQTIDKSRKQGLLELIKILEKLTPNLSLEDFERYFR